MGYTTLNKDEKEEEKKVFNLFHAHLLTLRTRSIPRSKNSVNSDFLNSTNLNFHDK